LYSNELTRLCAREDYIDTKRLSRNLKGTDHLEDKSQLENDARDLYKAERVRMD
jgi:hypothetical protein